MKKGDLVKTKNRQSNFSDLLGIVVDIRDNRRVHIQKMTTVEEVLILWCSDEFSGPSGYFLSNLFEVVSEAK
jgi:hypothetical protein